MSKGTSKAASAATAAATMTTPAQLERLGEHLRKLRLLKSGERLEALLQHAAANELPYAEFLEQVLGEEVAAKMSKNIAMRTAMARFPFVKPLETFEFDYQPSIDRTHELPVKRQAELVGISRGRRPSAVKGRRIFPIHGRSNFPTRLRTVVV